MRVIEVKHVEDCFDGSFIKELRFESEVTKLDVYFLGRFGEVQYFTTFARPFYKVRVKGKYDLKGIVGNKTLRVHLKSDSTEALEQFLEENGIEWEGVAV